MAKEKNPANTEEEATQTHKEDSSAKKHIPKKSGNEIDEIFSGKKRKKRTVDVEKKKKKVTAKKNKKSDEAADDVGLGDEAPKRRRKTNDGLTIYSEEELKINNSNAGGLRKGSVIARANEEHVQPEV